MYYFVVFIIYEYKMWKELEKYKLFIRNNMELSLKILIILIERFYLYKFWYEKNNFY